MSNNDFAQHSAAASQKGFSLVELMVAMILGLVLTFGAVTFFQDSLQSSRASISTSYMQDVAQVALEALKTDVRMAGFRGECVPSDTPATSGSTVSQFFSVMGEEGAGTNSDQLNIYTADIQSDTLFLRNYDRANNQLKICSNEDDGSGNCQAPDINLAPGTPEKPADLFLLSDCQNWAVFHLANAGSNLYMPANRDASESSVNLNDYLLPGTEAHSNKVKGVSANAFVLYKMGNSTTSGATEYQIIQDSNPEHALRSGAQPSILFRNDEPLVYGIENLQVLYGRSIGGKIQYNEGCNAVDFAAPSTCNNNLTGTTHLRISLVVQSDQRVGSNIARSFNIANPSGRNAYAAPADGRLRQVYSTTIKLRNAL